MRRIVTPELLDTDSGTPEEIYASLADLCRINRRFGGIRTTRKLVERVAQYTARRDFSLLDVAAGSGDVAQGVRDQLGPRGINVNYTLLDSALSHVNGYRPTVIADALTLPFHDDTFDLVSCSLFLHHLEPEQIAHFLSEALRVCRIAVLINDLRRSALHLTLIYAGLPTFRSRLTRHDSIASVRRSYTPDELRSMLTATKAAVVELHRSYLFRMGVIAWKSTP